MVITVNDQGFENITEPDDVFDDFKKNIKQSDEISEITSAKPAGKKHQKTSLESFSFANILTAVAGFFIALFYFFKERINRKYAIIALAIFAAVALTLTGYFIIGGSRSNNLGPTDPKEAAETYAKELAVCNYSAIESSDLIPTSKLKEVLDDCADFENYVENQLSAQADIYGASPTVKIKDSKISQIDDTDISRLGGLAKLKFDLILKDEQLKEGKTADVTLNISGNGNSAEITYRLFLIRLDEENGGKRWRIINSEYVDKYISVPKGNNFALQGDSYFD